MVGTLSFCCRGHGFDLWSGTKILQAAWCGQKRKKKLKINKNIQKQAYLFHFELNSLIVLKFSVVVRTTVMFKIVTVVRNIEFKKLTSFWKVYELLGRNLSYLLLLSGLRQFLAYEE